MCGSLLFSISCFSTLTPQLYREHSNDAMMLKHFIDFFDGKLQI
jgi:hypothetical protein